jgi:hypothetical protein
MNSLNEKITDLVRRIVRIRDDNENCIICNKPMCKGYEAVQVCHYIKRRHIETTWDLNNCHLGHEKCNQREENDKVYQDFHRLYVLNRIGTSEFMRLNRDKNKTVHLSKSDKLELIEYFKKYLKNLK